MKNNALLEPLIEKLVDITRLKEVQALLSWDQETVMSEGSIFARSEQSALIATLIHSQYKNKEFEQALGQWVDLESGQCQQGQLSEEEQQLVLEVYRDWHRMCALPSKFVSRFAQQCSQSQQVWAKAREKNERQIFMPYLKDMIELCQQKAHYWAPELSAYDALIDEYEPGVGMSQLDPLFKTLAQELSELVLTLSEQSKSFPNLALSNLDEEQQWAFGESILNEMGFNFNQGRQDRSTHPFTISMHPTDVRITTRFKEDDLMEGLSSSMHEGGHGLYEQGLNLDWYGTPFCEFTSLGIHESQSRFWENLIGRSWHFWKRRYHRLQSQFPKQLAAISLKDFYTAIHRVRPSLIRVESDEATYNLHIVIRYEVEKALFNGQVSTKDLPEYWASLYTQYLGVTPETDTEGFLQDVHWSTGSFGYFPTYALGNLYASQLYQSLSVEMTGLDQVIEQGPLSTINEWMKQKVHRVGRARTAATLIEEATGQGLSTGPFIQYLKSKYAHIQEISTATSS